MQKAFPGKSQKHKLHYCNFLEGEDYLYLTFKSKVMKFFTHLHGVFIKHWLTTSLLITKLTFIFLFMCCLRASATGYSPMATGNPEPVDLKKALTVFETNNSFALLIAGAKSPDREGEY